MSAVSQEELGDGPNEKGLAERPFHPFQEGGLTCACSWQTIGTHGGVGCVCDGWLVEKEESAGPVRS